MKKGRLTKEHLLEVTENGWLYFVKVFPELKNARLRNGKIRPIRNHLRGEKKPSLSFYLRNGNWMAKDFGDPDFYGDMFRVYAIVNGIDDIN